MEKKSHRSASFLTPQNPAWRLAYTFLHDKKTKDWEGKPLDTPISEVTVLVPKLHPDPEHCGNMKFLRTFIMEAHIKAGWGSTWLNGAGFPVKNGDEPPKPKMVNGQLVQPDPASWEFRKNHWYFRAGSSKFNPIVAILENGVKQELAARVINGRTYYKSGDYGVVGLHCYTYQNKTFGISFGLEGVIFTKDGEPIGTSGPKSMDAMFAGIGGPAPIQMAPAYTAPGGPPMPPGPSYTGAQAGPAPVGYAQPAIQTAPVVPQYVAPIQTVTPPGPSYAAPGPVAPAPALPPMPSGMPQSPGALPAFPPR